MKQQELFNQPYEVQIMPLVDYSLRGGHTDTDTYRRLPKSDFRKPGMHVV